MRRIIILIFVFFTLLTYETKAQLVHVKGVKGILGEYNSEKGGFGVGVGFYKLQTKRFSWKAIAEFHSSKQENTKTTLINGFGDLGYTVLSLKQQFFVSVTGGIGAGMEILEDNIFGTKKNSPMLIEGVGLSFEWCPIEKLTTAINFRQRFTQFNRNGSAYYMIGLSVQYNLN